MPSVSPPVLGEPLPLELVNTQFFTRGHQQDGLESTDEFSSWLSRVAERLPVALSTDDLAAVPDSDLTLARALREALRNLMSGAINRSPRDPKAIAVLNNVVRSAPYWRELSSEPGETVIASDCSRVDVALAAIADEGIELLDGPEAEMLRACPAPDCSLLFRKDHPRRKWCSERCSNRDRAARHYARHRK